jgi:hypothetical protein
MGIMPKFVIHQSWGLPGLVGIFCSVLPGFANAVQGGPYLSINANVAYGPSTISIDQTAFGDGVTYANGYPKALFSLANDGRFQYTASAGYVFSNNVGVEMKYIDFGLQHLIGVNGNSIGLWENGFFSGKYYGVNALYIVPINNGKQNFFVSVGEGNLRTNFTTTQTQTLVFSGTGKMQASQSEAALSLGVGLRFYMSPVISVNLEIDRLTPNNHGHVNSGIYNSSFDVISAGLVFTMP